MITSNGTPLRYDLYNVEIEPQNHVETATDTLYALAGFYYIKVKMEEVLFEGRRSIR